MCVRACVRVCVRACVRVCACVFGSLSPSPFSIFFLRFAFHRVRPLSFAPHPLPREKLEACIEHFECMIVNITVKPNVMFEINLCVARPAISPGKHFFLFFLFFFSLHPPFSPKIILCLRYSLLDYIDLYTMYFSCVFVCVFFGFILTATATVYITTCVLKNRFNFMRRLSVPVPAICNAWPVKNTDIDVIFSYLARCVLNVHLVLSVDLFSLALYWSLVNFVHIVVLFVLFVLVTAACGRWSPCYSTKLRQ